MAASPANFDSALPQWVLEQNRPWGGLRYRLIQANLARHIGDRPLRVLDAGGGNGLDALALAARGHRVDIVDYSPEMLAHARRQAVEAGAGDHVRVHPGDVRGVAGMFPESSFDVVLCHNVLQYVEDVPALFTDLRAPLKTGGVMSVVSINRHSMAYHAAFLRGDLSEALAQLDARAMQSITFDIPMTNYSLDEGRDMLEEAGWEIQADYGLRCICDYWGDNERKSDPAIFEQLERLEMELTARYPYKLLARYYQIIARKP